MQSDATKEREADDGLDKIAAQETAKAYVKEHSKGGQAVEEDDPESEGAEEVFNITPIVDLMADA